MPTNKLADLLEAKFHNLDTERDDNGEEFRYSRTDFEGIARFIRSRDRAHQRKYTKLKNSLLVIMFQKGDARIQALVDLQEMVLPLASIVEPSRAKRVEEMRAELERLKARRKRK